MTTSRRFFWMLLPAASLLTGCFDNALHGNNQPADEPRAVQGFVAVESATTLDVLIKQGNEFHVDLHVDANLVPLVTTRVVGSSLIIDSTKPIEPRIHGPHVIITMPKLEHVELSGSGDMRVANLESDATIDMVLSGSGNFAFSGKAPNLKMDLSGAGDMALSGSVDTLALDLSGSGNLDAKALSAARASADLSGAGNVSANVAGPVDVDLTGSGNIDLYGAPTIGHYTNTGSGELKVH